MCVWCVLLGQVVVGDIVKVSNGQFFPADLVLLSSRYEMFVQVSMEIMYSECFFYCPVSSRAFVT